MSVYLSEEEQIEAIKKWWKENGRSIIAGAVIGLAAVFGWQYWNDYQHRLAEEASSRFDLLQYAAKTGDTETAIQQAEALTAEHGDSAYAQFAALYLAKLRLEEGDTSAAQAHLQWVLSNSDEPSIQQMARLRLARLRLDQGDLEGAEAVIAQASEDSFAGEFAELRGDIAHSRKEYETARKAYQEALDKGAGDSSLVLMKLDDLAVAEVIQ